MANSPNYGELAEVGNVLKLREEIDQNQRATNFIRSSLSIVDIIPCSPILNLGALNKKEWAIKFEMQSAIDNYILLCNSYGLTTKSGVRLYLTDDTVASEEFQNNYDHNFFETAINKFSGMGTKFKGIKEIFESASQGSTEDLLNYVFNEASLQNIDKDHPYLKSAANIAMLGKKVGLPKIWESSSYNSGLTLTVKLVSPYGDPEAVKKFIIEPFIYLLLLAVPRSEDGLSYGLPTPVRVQAYGLSFMSVASIDSINVRRGGKEIAHNVYKQPLILDIFITVKPLIQGFAAITGKDDIAKIKDSISDFNDPPDQTAGISTIGSIIQSLRPAPSNISDEIKATSTTTAPKPGYNGSTNNGIQNAM